MVAAAAAAVVLTVTPSTSIEANLFCPKCGMVRSEMSCGRVIILLKVYILCIATQTVKVILKCRPNVCETDPTMARQKIKPTPHPEDERRRFEVNNDRCGSKPACCAALFWLTSSNCRTRSKIGKIQGLNRRRWGRAARAAVGGATQGRAHGGKIQG